MENYHESAKNNEVLDSKWYERFSEISFEDYEKLAGHKVEREEQKEQFLSDEIKNPQLDYPELETFDLEAREVSLCQLKEEILADEPNEAVAKIYRTKINEMLATTRMLKAARDGDDRVFSRYADFIYGTPDTSDANYIIRSVQDMVGKNIQSDNQNRQAAAQRLSLYLGDIDTSDDGGVDRSILPEGQEIPGSATNVDEVVEAFEDALADLGIDDWDVVVDTEKGLTNFSVSQEHKVVRVPEQEKLQARNLSKQKLQGLIAHEIYTHVARRHNGEHSKLKLLGLGLDRHIQAEEGIATYAEQQVTGAKEFAGIPRYLSVLIAKGVDGVPKDFRATYEIMKDYRLLASSKQEVESSDVESDAYNDCVRIFRGTSCSTPGAVYPKDMAYFGNRKIWSLVAQDSDIVQYFSVGKYDPANSEHVALLIKLGILDSELDDLAAEHDQK